MGNCSGKSIFYERIYPKIIPPYLTIFIAMLSLFNVLPLFSQSNYTVRTVVIDAGHGGVDPGAVGKITYEKHITLAIALKLGKYIEEKLKDVNVIYTRKKDRSLALDERSRIANEANADVFISIHVNSLENPSVYGTSSWVMGLHVSQENLKIAQRENSVIKYEDDHNRKYEGYDPHSAESFIIFSLMQNEYIDQSLNLASLIQNQFKKRLGRKDRGVHQAGFVVLWKTSMPAVLVETGFISNEKEERFLASVQGQDYIASAIFRAFRSYKQRIEVGKQPYRQEIKDTTEKNITKKDTYPIPKIETDKKSQIYFSLQLASSRKRLSLKSNQFKNIPEVREEKFDGVYKYYAGKFKTYKEANTQKSSLNERIKGTFIVAFENGKKVPTKYAISKTQ